MQFIFLSSSIYFGPIFSMDFLVDGFFAGISLLVNFTVDCVGKIMSFQQEAVNIS